VSPLSIEMNFTCGLCHGNGRVTQEFEQAGIQTLEKSICPVLDCHAIRKILYETCCITGSSPGGTGLWPGPEMPQLCCFSGKSPGVLENGYE
jgi:hypothetical protein